MKKRTGGASRREFIKTSAVASLAVLGSSGRHVFAAGSGRVRAGLVGCGERGTSAAHNCLESSPHVEFVAMGDVFRDRLDRSLNYLKERFPADRLKVTPDTSFVGFDAYKKVLASDVDLVLLTTPPHFHPEHFAAAVEAGKHVFMEKPAAVDPVGIRKVLAASKVADEKKLSVVVGTQQRRQRQYQEVMKRVHGGGIGDIVAAQCYWHWGDSDWHHELRQPGWSDMEWQIRAWPYFTWLSGDHIVEQHCHNLDIVNWAIGTHPEKCLGVGGRQARTTPDYGNIFDHFAVEYVYPGGVRVLSMASQMAGTTSRVSERLTGTKGMTHTTRGFGTIEGENPYKYEGEVNSGFVKEHADLIESIRNGTPLNEAQDFAESTLTAIMGRMSAYTGRELSWDWVMNASKLDLTPPKYEMGDLPVRPVAIPGKTKLV